VQNAERARRARAKYYNNFFAFRAPRAATALVGMIGGRRASTGHGHRLASRTTTSPGRDRAVGDWLNDVRCCEGRCGFAMAQAPDELKAVASDVLEADA
jgi:hypothetical protein